MSIYHSVNHFCSPLLLAIVDRYWHSENSNLSKTRITNLCECYREKKSAKFWRISLCALRFCGQVQLRNTGSTDFEESDYREHDEAQTELYTSAKTPKEVYRSSGGTSTQRITSQQLRKQLQADRRVGDYTLRRNRLG